MEVKVKTKYEIHICVWLTLQYMHDNLLKNAYLLLGAARKLAPPNI